MQTSSRPGNGQSRLFLIRSTLLSISGLVFSALSWAAPFAYIPSHGSLAIVDIASGRFTHMSLEPGSMEGVSVNRAGTRVFVTNSGSKLHVLDVSGSMPTSKSVTLSSVKPFQVAAHPDGKRAFVLGWNSLHVVNSDTLSSKLLALPSPAIRYVGLGISPDGAYAYVSDGSTVHFVKTSDGSVTSLTLPGGSLGSLAVSPDGSRLYVALNSYNQLAVINTLTKNLFTVSVGKQPGSVAANPNGRQVVVTNNGDASVSIIDTSDYSVTSKPTIRQPFGVSFNRSGSEFWVNGISGALYRHSAATGANIGTIDTGLTGAVAAIGNFVGPDTIGQSNGPVLTLPPVDGISAQPIVLDLTSGHAACIVSAVAMGMLDTSARYLGQGPDGVAKIGLSGGRRLAFYPVEGPDTFDISTGFQLTDTNVVRVGTACGKFGVVPAMNKLSEFALSLSKLGSLARIGNDGVMTMTVGTSTNIVRPSFFAEPGGGGSPSLTKAADGNYRMSDSSGYVQTLYPAFAQLDAVESVIFGPWGVAGSWIIQADATGLLSANDGRQYQLVPNMTLTLAPESLGTNWQEGDGRVYVRQRANEMAQGFTVINR